MNNPGQAVEVQVAVDPDDDEPPQPDAIRQWAGAALAAIARPDAALTVRIVEPDEGRTLNRDFRGRDYATNVLSFPFSELPPEAMAELGAPYMGDIAICARVVEREAAEQGKASRDHWAHMVVHGVLHLAGYDHTDAAGAQRMEADERTILATFGIADPYGDEPDGDSGQTAPVGEDGNR